jgi:acyl-CoA thioester hydrolase
MQGYRREVEVRWSDLDPNFHLRHSVYYDWGAFIRLSFLSGQRLTNAVLERDNIGLILFREECVFKREIVFGDKIEIGLELGKCRKDMSRWTIVHEVWKNDDTLSAIVTVDGAWIDTKIRKLAIPPIHMQESFSAIPKSENFVWMEG